jgi:hypothetical protein
MPTTIPTVTDSKPNGRKQAAAEKPIVVVQEREKEEEW